MTIFDKLALSVFVLTLTVFLVSNFAEHAGYVRLKMDSEIVAGALVLLMFACGLALMFSWIWGWGL